jgi:hypothetical protein
MGGNRVLVDQDRHERIAPRARAMTDVHLVRGRRRRGRRRGGRCCCGRCRCGRCRRSGRCRCGRRQCGRSRRDCRRRRSCRGRWRCRSRRSCRGRGRCRGCGLDRGRRRRGCRCRHTRTRVRGAGRRGRGVDCGWTTPRRERSGAKAERTDDQADRHRKCCATHPVVPPCPVDFGVVSPSRNRANPETPERACKGCVKPSVGTRSGRFDAELASAERGHVILGEEKQKLVELPALLRVERAEQLVVELPAQRA